MKNIPVVHFNLALWWVSTLWLVMDLFIPFSNSECLELLRLQNCLSNSDYTLVGFRLREDCSIPLPYPVYVEIKNDLLFNLIVPTVIVYNHKKIISTWQWIQKSKHYSYQQLKEVHAFQQLQLKDLGLRLNLSDCLVAHIGHQAIAYSLAFNVLVGNALLLFYSGIIFSQTSEIKSLVAL